MSAEPSSPAAAAAETGAFPARGGGKRLLATIAVTGRAAVAGSESAEILARSDASVIRALCEKHDGRVIKALGDGSLLFFHSATGAVACALEIQITLAAGRSDIAAAAAHGDGDGGSQHGIGIHLGDVFVQADDVTGDGVLIAAQLQAEAGPGGICVSQTVLDVVRSSLDLQAVPLGSRVLKNVRDPLPIHRLLLTKFPAAAQSGEIGDITALLSTTAAGDERRASAATASRRGSELESDGEDDLHIELDAAERTTLSAMLGLPTPRRRPRRTRWWHLVLGIGGAGALLAVAIAGYFRWRHSATPTRRLAARPATATATTGSSPAAADPVPGAGRPAREEKSIAVLPFLNLSEDPQNDFFARGVHDDVLTQLGHVSDLKVISRTSVQAYQGPDLRNTSLREIGEALGAAAIVEGSVRRAGNRVRVTAQLIDARTDRHLWADTYDRDLTDVFAIQTAIARDIVNALRANLSPRESERLARRPTTDPEAYDFYLRARDIALRPGNLRENLEAALLLSDQALARDPDFALAHTMQANLCNTIYWYAYDRTPARLARARASLDRALALQPDLPEAHLALGYYYYWGFRDYARGLAEFAIARRDLPNDPAVYAALGFIQRRQGKWDEALANLQKNAELDPRNADHRYEVALTLLYMRRYPETDAALAKALSLAPDYRAAGYHRGILAMKMHGETRTLRAALEGVHAGLDENFWCIRRFQLEMLDRRFDAALALLAASPLEKFEWQDFLYPKALLAAQAYQARGDAATARTHFDAARATLEDIAQNAS